MEQIGEALCWHWEATGYHNYIVRDCFSFAAFAKLISLPYRSKAIMTDGGRYQTECYKKKERKTFGEKPMNGLIIN